MKQSQMMETMALREIMARRRVGILPTVTLAVILALFPARGVFSAEPLVWSSSEAEGIVSRMQAAYNSLEDYQAHLVIAGYGDNASFPGIQRLTYTFKKPDKIRVDFETPHKDMTIVFPDAHGDVAVRPGFLPFTFRLGPRNSLLEISPGQHIDQTDLGLLIRNIAHSLTDMYIGDLKITREHERVVIRVLSDNPFRKGTPTRYVFTIDERLWLPVEVEESTAGGVLAREVIYRDLRTNIGVKDSFFRLD